MTGLESRLSESDALLVGILSDEGSLVVANVGVEGRHEHEGLVHDALDLVAVGLHASNTVQV